MLRDRYRLSKRLRTLSQQLRRRQAVARGVQEVWQQIERSRAVYEKRKAGVPAISYPEDLPISAKRQDISEAIAQHQVVIIAGETGSGKTTQLPKICLELGRGIAARIGHTQPRRMAARSVAGRIAQELDVRLGEEVGYKVRFSDHSRHDSYLKLMTDGILLAEIQQDKRLEQYDTIIIDEAHERSLNIDFLLGYLKQLLPKRPDLKLIVTSATINTAQFSAFFDDAPVIEVSGRSYPVDIVYHPVGKDDDDLDTQLPQAVVSAVDEASSMDAWGDILVFLPGEREIREVLYALEQHGMRDTEVIPLFSRLSAAEQDKVFQSHRGRRIVLATNVAETSLTVPGIRFVIDSGLVRMSRYSTRTKVQRLPIEPVSQASANQRAGRCGRVSAGVCIRLYDEANFKQRSEHTDPEILRTNLASVILQMANLGLGDVATFPLMNPPESRSITDGYRLLHELQAVDEQRRLTTVGKQLVRLPVDPRLGRMLLHAQKEGALREVLVIVSALSVQDPRMRPMDAQQKADEKQRIFKDETSDFSSWLKLWDWYHEQQHKCSKNQLRKQCQQHFLSFMRLREWHDLHGQLLGMMRELKLQPNKEPAGADAIHRSLLAGLLGHIALKDEGTRYLGARNLKVSLFPGSGLYKKPPKWVMAAHLVETNRLYARMLAAIEPAWLEDLAQHLIKKEYSEPHWSTKRAQVMAYERVSLFGLPVVTQRRVGYAKIDAVVSRELFVRHALVQGEYRTHGKYAPYNRQLLRELEQMDAKARRRDVCLDEQVLFDFFDALIPEHVCSGKNFEQWRKQAEAKQPRVLFLDKKSLLAGSDGVDTADFPDAMQVGTRSLRLRYHFDPSHHADGVSLLVAQDALASVQQERCDWLVPGMLQEKLVFLIKSLPKNLRKHVVPAPEFARAAAEAMPFAQGNLLRALACELERMSGVYIPLEAWDLSRLPAYMQMTYCVLDAHKKTLAESNNLAALQQKFALQPTQDAPHAAHPLEQKGCTSWDFSELPQEVQSSEQGVQLRLFPAVVDEGESVGVQLFEQPHEAERAMRLGVRRLLMLAMPQQVKALHQDMKKNKSMMMQAALLGDATRLRQQVIEAAFSWVFLSDGALPRSQDDFEVCLQQGRARLMKEATRVIQWVDDALQAHARVSAALQHNSAVQKQPVIEDVRQQCQHLMGADFVAEIPVVWLRHLARFLDAACMRLEKSGRDLSKDAQMQQQVQNFWQAYQQRIQMVAQPSDDLVHFRWMIEELRVSLFAQSLKTSCPVSVKRLEKAWQKLR